MALDVRKLSEVLTGRAERDLRENRIGGADILVNCHGERVFDLKIGRQNSSGDPLREDALYRIASMTKPITAAAVMQQVSAGKIDLTAPVSDYLPDYRVMMLGHAEGGRLVIDGPAKNPILVFHLLCHTNGIDVCPMYDQIIKNHPCKKLADTVAYYAKMPLAFEPYTAAGYSESAGFDAAARIVELVSGEEYGDYIRKHITEPLGMQDTTFAPTPEQWSRMVSLFARTPDGRAAEARVGEGCVFENISTTCCLAGAGLASTAEDYSKFAEMLRLRGTGANGAGILSPDAVRILSTAHVEESVMPGSDRWGLGMRVVVGENASGLPRGTFGWSGAYGSHFWVDPVNDITAVYMRNSVYDSSGCGSIGVQFEKDVMSAVGA